MTTEPNNDYEGYCVGERCNRDGCQGIISEHESDYGCSCHINPPCSFCETSREYCPECDWDGYEEQMEQIRNTPKPTKEQEEKWAAERKKANEIEKEFQRIFRSKESVTEFDYRKSSHTHFSMIVKGVHPESMSRSDVFEEVKGSFGGRFTRFDNGRFEFVAYTD